MNCGIHLPYLKTTAANICVTNVTLAAGGTEETYESHGVIYSTMAVKDALNKLNDIKKKLD